LLIPVCGDTIFIETKEKCDDGNLEKNDGCDEKCMIEDDWKCQVFDSCTPVCGDSVVKG